VYSRYNNGPGMYALTGESSVYAVSAFMRKCHYASRNLGRERERERGRGREGEGERERGRGRIGHMSQMGARHQDRLAD
jgi:hypothetical protein